MKIMLRVAAAGLAAAVVFVGAGAASASVSSKVPAAQIQAGLAQVWTADTAASVTLPGGKVLYVGGDATVDMGKPYGTSTMWWFPHQVGALESYPGSGVFTSVRGQSDPYGCNCQLVPSFPNGDYFWPGGLAVTGSVVYLYGQEIHGAGLSASPVVNYVARFNAYTLAYLGRTQLTGLTGLSDAVAWPGGHWLVASTYVGGPDCSYAALYCFTGSTVWIPSGAELSPSRWTTYAGTIPASFNAGSTMEPFRFGGRWYIVTKYGDQFGGYSYMEELTAGCMAGCPWHQTGKTWPAQGSDSYSARVHPGEASTGILISNSAGNPYGSYFEQETP